MQKIRKYTSNHCERCGKPIAVNSTLCACTVTQNNDMDFYLLCQDCMHKLNRFMDGYEPGDKNIHIPF